MKGTISILLLFFSSFGFSQSTKIKVDGEYRSILMDTISVKEIFFKTTTKKPMKKNFTYTLWTEGQAQPDWLTDAEIHYLYGLIESDREAICIIQSVASVWPDSNYRTTIGNIALGILYAYKENLPFPVRSAQLVICADSELKHKDIITSWYKEYQK